MMHLPDRKLVLIGSPIHQKPAILRLFLQSLLHLNKDNLTCHYLFIDDNQEQESSELLKHFSLSVPAVSLRQTPSREVYIRNQQTHFWNEHLVWKVADFKNQMIQYALDLQADYLFLLDSDLLLHPCTLKHLLAQEKPIISEIFWTKWQLDSDPQPQVWMWDEYKQWEQSRGEHLSKQDIQERYQQFIRKLRQPGVYEVGGLGACTLIHAQAMKDGVLYKPIHNLSFWGEDRHFCVRAAALGYSLYVDTHYPAYHIYRDSDLEEAEAYQLTHHEASSSTDTWNLSFHSETLDLTPTEDQQSMSTCQHTQPSNKLTLSMVLKNESDRFLRQVLSDHRLSIHEAVIIDDGSSDDTAEICYELLKDIPLRIIRNPVSTFHNEIQLRKQQWQETIATNPDWILNLDGDEQFETAFHSQISEMMKQQEVDMYCFRLYDFWDESHYREDCYWKAHTLYRPFLVRYRKEYHYRWKETAQHCGRFPDNIFELPYQLSPLRLKHWGWSTPKLRSEKYERYMKLDPEGRYGWMDQYLSIQDLHPNLVAWEE